MFDSPENLRFPLFWGGGGGGGRKQVVSANKAEGDSQELLGSGFLPVAAGICL